MTWQYCSSGMPWRNLFPEIEGFFFFWKALDSIGRAIPFPTESATYFESVVNTTTLGSLLLLGCFQARWLTIRQSDICRCYDVSWSLWAWKPSEFFFKACASHGSQWIEHIEPPRPGPGYRSCGRRRYILWSFTLHDELTMPVFVRKRL